MSIPSPSAPRNDDFWTAYRAAIGDDLDTFRVIVEGGSVDFTREYSFGDLSLISEGDQIRAEVMEAMHAHVSRLDFLAAIALDYKSAALVQYCLEKGAKREVF